MLTMKSPVYNTIGKTYDTTRKADPIITQKIMQHLQAKPPKKYLDIGCGSGNYTGALFNQGLNIEGIDLSTEMLGKAKNKYPSISWHEGDARQLPFENNSYDGATCILATHHIKDIDAAFKEAFRVISQGRLVIFTATPEQCDHYWLKKYFPLMIEQGAELMSSFERLEQALSAAGFKNIHQDPFFVTPTLQDWFLQAGKYRPEIYLDPVVRAGISSFPLAKNQDEIEKGCAMLLADIEGNKIQDVIHSYENTLGDYLFVIAEK
jgi:ubiquinone/menaquinone biosynthesis C-methylase UbiE